MDAEAFSNGVLGWIIRLAGLFWLFGAAMLFRQIRMEMALDRMTSQIQNMAREVEADGDAEARDENGFADMDRPVRPRPKTAEEKRIEDWIDRDDAARRGWIAAQSVVLAVTAGTMIALHPMAAWMAALLILGQGAYFFWREHTARHAPNAEAAAHARPSAATVNAGWVSLIIAMLVWAAAFQGLLK